MAPWPHCGDRGRLYPVRIGLLQRARPRLQSGGGARAALHPLNRHNDKTIKRTEYRTDWNPSRTYLIYGVAMETSLLAFTLAGSFLLLLAFRAAKPCSGPSGGGVPAVVHPAPGRDGRAAFVGIGCGAFTSVWCESLFPALRRLSLVNPRRWTSPEIRRSTWCSHKTQRRSCVPACRPEPSYAAKGNICICYRVFRQREHP